MRERSRARPDWIGCALPPGAPYNSGSMSNMIHDTVSPLAFLALIIAVGVFGLDFRSRPEWRSLWIYSIATSFVATIFMAALVASLESRDLTGLWQRLVVVTLFSWTAIVGLRLHRLHHIDEGSE